MATVTYKVDSGTTLYVKTSKLSRFEMIGYLRNFEVTIDPENGHVDVDGDLETYGGWKMNNSGIYTFKQRFKADSLKGIFKGSERAIDL